MASYSSEERYDMFCTFIACGRNAERSAAKYLNDYPERRQPHRTQFQKVAKHVYEQKNFLNANKHREINEVAEINVLAALEVNNLASSRELSLMAGTSAMTTLRVLHKNKYKPYHKRCGHTLNGDQDPIRRINFCRWFINQKEENEEFPRTILWTDESKFTNCGIFNRHNEVLWRQENPHLLQEIRPQVKFGFNVLCGIYDNQVVGPFIYNSNLTGQRYLQILQNEMQDALEQLPLLQLRKIRWFQQDGAPAHNSHISMKNIRRGGLEPMVQSNGQRDPQISPLWIFFYGVI